MNPQITAEPSFKISNYSQRTMIDIVRIFMYIAIYTSVPLLLFHNNKKQQQFHIDLLQNI